MTDAMLTLEVNGAPVRADVPAQTLLVELLRGPLGLTGTHVGCETAQCGACTVLLDGQAVKSCSMLAWQARGRQVTTIEGLAPVPLAAPNVGADPAGALHPIQQAFVDCHGLQCGFCTPGFIMATAALLREQPLPTEAQIVQALEGNLCRCTGYVNIVAAVKLAAQTLASQTLASQAQATQTMAAA